MKNKLVIIIFLICFKIFGQSNKQTINVVFQEIPMNFIKEYYKDSSNNIYTVLTRYSNEKISYGEINLKDTLFLNSLKEESGRYKYKALLKFSLDSKNKIIPSYILNKCTLLDENYKIDNLQLILFNELNFKEDTDFDCDEIIYQRVIYNKSFDLTSAIIVHEKNKIYLKLINQKCKVTNTKTLEKNIKIFDGGDYILIKKNDGFTILFEN